MKLHAGFKQGLGDIWAISLLLAVMLAALRAAPAFGQPADDADTAATKSDDKAAAGDKPAASNDSAYFDVHGAKDCAYDELRQRLYVTTPDKLIVVDTKNKKVLPGVDLQGDPLGCDVSPDFKYLAIGPAKGQFLYWLRSDWRKLGDMDISQVRFKGQGSEIGVFAVAIGSDDTALFSTSFAGSGWVTLRKFDPRRNRVLEVGQIRMDSAISASPDRNFAAIVEGDISSGPLKLYDFKQKKLKAVTDTDAFNYEVACARNAKYIAVPNRAGCALYTAHGTKLNNFDGAAVISAAFDPKDDSLFLMRAGETTIERLDVNGQTIASDYELDKPLVSKADVHQRYVTNIHATQNTLYANTRRVTTANLHAYRAGRMKVSQSGQKLFVVVPTGVYMFAVKTESAPKSDSDSDAKPKIKVIEGN